MTGSGVSIAADNETGEIVRSQPPGVVTFAVYQNQNDQNPFGIGNGNPAMEVDALNHQACGAQWTTNAIACLDLSQNPPTITTSPAGVVGNQPWLLRIFNVNGILQAVTYNRADATVCSYGIPSFTPNGCVAVPGFTKSGNISLANMVNAGWEMVAFRSGPLANTIAVLSRYDHLVGSVDVNSMTLLGQPIF